MIIITLTGTNFEYKYLTGNQTKENITILKITCDNISHHNVLNYVLICSQKLISAIDFYCYSMNKVISELMFYGHAHRIDFDDLNRRKYFSFESTF